jgi:predicted acylesterase/phospholipase RssA
MRKALSISGGGSKFGQLASTSLHLVQSKGFVPDIIAGVSAGAVISVPLALGMFEELQYYAINLSKTDFFDIAPTNKKGAISFRGMLRAMFGKPSFGVQNIKKTLRKIVTPAKFKEYKEGNYADCFVLSISPDTGSRRFQNVKLLNYEGYLAEISASSSIPIMTEGEKISGSWFYDGGMRDHNGSGILLEQFAQNISELVSIYSRPKDFKTKKRNWRKNVLSVIERTLEIYNIETSKNDERLERLICEKEGIKLSQIFVSSILEDFYDDNKERLLEAFEDGKNAVEKYYNK